LNNQPGKGAKMDQRNPETIQMFYMWLSAPQPKMDKVTSAIAEITTREGRPRADLAEYIDYCEQAISRTYQIETECKEKRDALPAGDCDVEEELISAERKRINFEEAYALAMWEVFENRIALAQRIIDQRAVPPQRKLSNTRAQLAKEKLTVHQAANRMQNDLSTKGTARAEDVVKVLGNPAKSVSIAPSSTKH
jgi:hypothetical protein